jgi:hypothetical protein
MAKSRKAAQSVDFNDRLVLFKYFLSTLSAKNLKSFENLNDVRFEGFDINGNTLFYRELDVRLSSPIINNAITINRDKLKQYDENICRHLRQICEKRGIINLKYFQYLSLLFTEIYLDRLFNDKDEFVHDLNVFIKKYSNDLFYSLRGVSANIKDYTPNKMNRLGFMCATGSGKTLIMHINILQFRHYNRQASHHYHGIDINKTILLSPNEGMSLQHIDEFRLSNIPASLFQKDGYGFDFGKDDILVIDMNKLKEEGKVKTVSIDSFEQNNLVLIDEAHRGIQGDVWFDYRNRLSAEGGFSFEYSATFKQALKSLKPTVNSNETLLNEYGKSIIIDYSYKYFYEDGYCKDYRSYNLQEGIDSGEQRNIYLTGCLLSFYQQVKLYNEYKNLSIIFEIENPLLVFVGNRVTSPISKGSSLDAGEKELLTDIEAVLLFIDSFVNNKSKTLQRIKKVIEAKTSIVDKKNTDIFSSNFSPLEKIFGSSLTPEIIYSDILNIVFNSGTHSESPRLYLIDIKSQGEIGLKIGQNGDFFGVINIGDTTNLIRQCEEKGIVTNKDEFSTPSLFRNINTSGSIIKLLIGSRKFTEGWNCWRVSTMGLINFAKGEGSQAIQLFGRGVRLHGYANRLKRSNRVENPPTNIPKEISFLETLTIFGIKADYMAKFKEYLELEGLPPNDQIYSYSMPTVNRFDNIKEKNLKVLRVKEGINFKKQAQRFMLDVPDNQSTDYFVKNKIILDCRAKVQNITSPEDYKLDLETNIKDRRIDNKYLQYLDFDTIYWQLIQYKNEKKYYNIALEKKILPDIMKNYDWYYGLIIPEDELNLNTFEKANKATSYVALVLQSYIDKFFTYQKNKWEAPYLVYQDIKSDDPNFFAEYTFTYQPEHSADTGFMALEKYVNDLNKLLSRDKAILRKGGEYFSNGLITFDSRHHLFVPLVYKSNELTTIQVSPVSLNSDEKDFVFRLSDYISHNNSQFENIDLFLLRNKSKVGMGFFEAGNFYPDYILWIDTKDAQYMTFIDPKGLQYYQINDPKIQFYKTIKELEQRPLLKETKGNKDIILNSFIISGSSYVTIKKQWGINDKEELSDMHVLFLDQQDCIKTMFDKLLGV